MTLRTVAHQAPLSMEFSRPEYWSGQPFPSSGYLPNPGIKFKSPALEADCLLSEPAGKPVIKKVKVFINGELQIWRQEFQTGTVGWGR